MHTESPLDFETTKLETLVVTERRNVFCSLGYFKTWSLRQSLCRQISQQTSLDSLRYSLAGEMVFNFAMETWQHNQNKHSLYIHSKP